MTTPPGLRDELRNVAETLAVEAAHFVASRRVEVFDGDGARPQPVRTKSAPTDPVTVVDTDAEQLLRQRLATLRPGDPVLGEEGGGPRLGPPGAVTWVLDPIDGTVNFMYGIPAYSVSVAAQVDGESVAGAVAVVPSGEVYSAALGLGAQVRGSAGVRALRCNQVDELAMALVGTGFAYLPARRAKQAWLLAGLLPQIRDVRRLGSAALDLCMVGAGLLDAHYEHGLNVWDWAAGALIAAEAGAQVVLPDLTAPDAPVLVAAAPGVARALLDALDGLGGLGALDSSHTLDTPRGG
ncbi:MAG: inositol monophosphatase family protein [Mycobacterium sp.]